MASEQDKQQNMKKAHNPNDDKTGDIMSDSFGVAYATRCEDEGFGGTYGGKQWRTETENVPKTIIHENHPEYDETLGSEAMAKEKDSSG